MPVTVELYRTQERANAEAKRAAARAGAGAALGVRRLTPASLVEELWEVWGDGRELVDGSQRSLLAASLVAGDDGLSQLAGAGEALAAFCAKAAGRLADLEARGERVPVAGVNRDVLGLAERYRGALADRGLIELDEAAWVLAKAARDGVLPPTPTRAAESLDATFGIATLLEALGCSEGCGGARSENEDVDGAEVDLLVASGFGAVPGLVLDNVRARMAAGARQVLVVAPDGAKLCGTLQGALASEGASVVLRASRAWGDTLIGRALENLCRVASASHWREAATDFALNPLALCRGRDARAVNRKLREDRLIDAQHGASMLAEVCEGYEALSALAKLVNGDGGVEAEPICRATAGAIAAAQLSPVERSGETAALQSLCAAVETAGRLGEPVPLAYEVVRSSTLSYAAASAPFGSPSVEFASAERLDTIVPDSYDAVVLVDLSNRLFPLKEPLSCLNDLSEQLGLPRGASMAARQRERFASALQAARGRVSCVVSRRDERGGDLYPSFLLEELAASQAARGEARALAAGTPHEAEQWQQRDRSLFNMPLPVAQRAVSVGEEGLAASVGRAFAKADAVVELPLVTRGMLNQLDILGLVATAGDGRMPVLSPSAIEQYLACPYRWFVSSCLRPEAPDEGFGAPELGTFAHEVFAAFYDELAAEGVRSLSGASADEHIERLDRIFDERLAAQRAKAPGRRLAATALSERLEVEALRGHLRRSIRLQAALPPSFSVLAHERRIEVEDGVDFAGMRIKGRIDRVDVDEAAARFLIVDYKGSSEAYAAGVAAEDEVALPGHIQALIYAAAFERIEPKMACVGALYLGYRARRADKLMEGSYDPVAFDGAAIGSGKSAVEMSFSVFLEQIEALVAERMMPLMRGAIPVRPASADACAFCPAANCPGRLS